MEINIAEVKLQQALAIRDNCPASELSKKYHELYGEISPVFKNQALPITGAPFGLYHKFTPEDVEVEAGIPVGGKPAAEGRVKVINTFGGKAAHATYIGPYEGLGGAWEEFMKLIEEKKYKVKWPCFEVYTTDPGAEPDSLKWITELYFPIEN